MIVNGGMEAATVELVVMVAVAVTVVSVLCCS